MTISTVELGDVSCDEFVYGAVEHQLQLQLDRYRDVLTLSLGLIAAALAGVAFLLVDKASRVDDVAAGFLTFGGVISGFALFYGWDADVAPDAETLATTYEEDPELVRGSATAGMLITIRQNEISLWRKMMLVRCALFVILSAAVVGIASKVVESR